MCVIDKDFKLRVVKGLRVVDMIVYPILTNSCTNVNAYVIGDVAKGNLIGKLNFNLQSRT
jgi:hypothetical protein